MPRIHDIRTAPAGAALAAFLCLPFAACAGHTHPAPHAHHAAVRVAVAEGHVHSARCGHYRHRGRWYHVRGHLHGPRCGHVFVGGIWVLRR